ncbi:MAG: hypothetical protein H0U42_09005 [Thermoleophilaceae bacterium]|nr:hypothetical protein [Thermoleophilaceae bacterium]
MADSSSAKKPAARKPAAKKPAARKPAARKPAAKKPAAKKPAAKKPAAKASASRAATSAKRAKPAAKKPAAKKKPAARKPAVKKPAARKSAARRSQAAPDLAGKAINEFREALQSGAPPSFVILTRERMEEVMDEAVKRGRVTVDDAQSVVQTLLDRARKETNDVVQDLEKLIQRGRSEVESATTKVRTRAVRTGDPALAQVDRVRRAAGVGPSFPVLGYDDLTAAQVSSRLTTLSPAELRKVRDYEKRNANRKSVLNSISTKLG